MKTILRIVFVVLTLTMTSVSIAQTPEVLLDSIKKLDSIITMFRDPGYQSAQVINFQKIAQRFEKQFDSLSKAKEKEVNELNARIGTQKSTIDSLEKLNKKLEPGWKCVIREMAENVDQVWLNKCFGEIDSTEFAAEFELYERFKGDDKGVGDAYQKLKSLRDNYMLYLEGVRMVNSPYEADRVKKLITSFTELEGKEKHQGRKKEIHTVGEQLGSYKRNLRYFKDVIIGSKEKGTGISQLLVEVNNIGITDKEIIWGYIERFFQKNDKAQIEKDLTEVPWLGQQYHNYVEALKKDPYGYNEAQEIIKGLEP